MNKSSQNENLNQLIFLTVKHEHFKHEKVAAEPNSKSINFPPVKHEHFKHKQVDAKLNF